MHELFYKRISSPFGDVGLIWKWKKETPSISRILLPKETGRIEGFARQCGADLCRRPVPGIDEICGRICEYLKGKPIELPLSLLDLDSCGGFQKKVLLAERNIPRGRVGSYGGLALKLGVPGAARAVGAAQARNPFPLVIPCHRVVRSDGSLGGFGGGLRMKRALLEMEGVRFDARGRVEEVYF